MTDPSRPRKKSPFAGGATFGAGAPAPTPPPAPRGDPRGPMLIVGLAVALIGAVVFVWSATRRAPPPPVVVALEPPATDPSGAAPSTSPAASAPSAAVVAKSAPTPPRATVAPAASGVALPPEQRRVIAKARPRLLACYEAALKVDPSAGGTASVTLELEPSGKVKDAKVSGASPASLNPCLAGVMRALTFGPSDGARTLAFPLVLDGR